MVKRLVHGFFWICDNHASTLVDVCVLGIIACLIAAFLL